MVATIILFLSLFFSSFFSFSFTSGVEAGMIGQSGMRPFSVRKRCTRPWRATGIRDAGSSGVALVDEALASFFFFLPSFSPPPFRSAQGRAGRRFLEGQIVGRSRVRAIARHLGESVRRERNRFSLSPPPSLFSSSFSPSRFWRDRAGSGKSGRQQRSGGHVEKVESVFFFFSFFPPFIPPPPP